MSRVGKNPVIIPEGVNVAIDSNMIIAKGKLGELTQAFDAKHVEVTIDGNQVKVSPKSESKVARSLWGTTRANINIIVKGVSDGFTKELELVGVGYKARVEGTKLIMSLGFSHDVVIETPKELKVTCASPTQISISGANKQLVGQMAAELREYRKPEPYKGKGVRYAGEHVRRKEGKKK